MKSAIALHQEVLQGSDPGVVAIADPDLARQRGATLNRFGAMLVSQFEM